MSVDRRLLFSERLLRSAVVEALGEDHYAVAILDRKLNDDPYARGERDAMATTRRGIDFLVAIIAEFVDDGPCSYDHDDYCQTHYSQRTCVNERARVVLASWGDGA